MLMIEDTAPRRLGGLVEAARAKGRAEREPVRPPSVVLVGEMGPKISARSRQHPQTIFVAMSGLTMMRAGVACVAPRQVCRVLLALFGRQGGLLSREELVDAMYLGRRAGGAEYADKVLHVAMTHARTAGAALGFRVETFHGRGARIVDARASA